MLSLASARRAQQGGPCGRSSLLVWCRSTRQPAPVVLGRFHSFDRRCYHADKPNDDGDAKGRYTEKVVREAAQRFRGTLPKGYLNDEEYALYKRLYGAPQRETEPDDVGIPTHADLANNTDDSPTPMPRERNLGDHDANSDECQTASSSGENKDPRDELKMSKLESVEREADYYVDTVARNEREFKALLRLAEDFKTSRREHQKEMDEEQKAEEEARRKKKLAIEAEEKILRDYLKMEVRNVMKRKETQGLVDKAKGREAIDKVTKEEAADEEAEEEEADQVNPADAEGAKPPRQGRKWKSDPNGPPKERIRPRKWHAAKEREIEDQTEDPPDRYHPWTLLGRFHERPMPIQLPLQELDGPVRLLLSRTHIDHIRNAARLIFSAQAFANSPGTVVGSRNSTMEGLALMPDQRSMSNIEADTFLAFFLPPMYASVLSVLREVRRRCGADWLQSRLKKGEKGAMSLLDAGSGGAALVAWDMIVKAEWEMLLDTGKIRRGYPTPSKKTALVASERLRDRVRTFLPDTTFITELPDYRHSGETRGEHIEAGKNMQPRKQYDVVFASHLLLKEEVGHRRQAVLERLWSMVSPDGGILVIIEKGHPRGFEAMAHARDTVLNEFLKPQSGYELIDTHNESVGRGNEDDDSRESGHVIAPCPTQGTCPMYRVAGLGQGRRDFCHFDQKFIEPPYYKATLGPLGKNLGRVEFSYVAIRRGVARTEGSPSGIQATRDAFAGYEESNSKPDMQTVPRQILRPLKKTRHVIMDMCTPDGSLERWTVPKSYGRLAYHDARKSRWGDLWALGAKTRVKRHVRAGTVEVTHKMRHRFRKQLSDQVEEKKRANRAAGEAEDEGAGGKLKKKRLTKTQKNLMKSEKRRQKQAQKRIMKELAKKVDGSGVGKASGNNDDEEDGDE
ncbi:37S ribosomal protein Rsm22 [Ophiocordyceps camponoti-floridani]|uniref:37S ribosomal protein Rsm22 n=1 Tax=Ophiocordyceps camponoti-floridani TaxID=2030778 RepID=A0A8H4QD89_9HYPO|nr:37S ribosomal protein Rsm22 [Ophiocordyceps camponoti-floridani]